MRKHLHVHGYGTDTGKRTRVKLVFDDGKLCNPLAMARSCVVGWGPWQSQHKVQTKWGPAWYVTTAGHGGYILVSQTKDVPFGSPVFKVEHEYGNVYVHEFEEDCNWAILEYLDAGVREWAYKRLHNNGKLTADEYVTVVRNTVERWAPEYLVAVPATPTDA